MTTAAETTIDQAEPSDDPPDVEKATTVHLARCTQCDFTVKFEPSITGTSFFLVGSDAALGIGPNGRPVCPNGHDEMEIADDQIPVSDAIAQTAERLKTPEQRSLPGIVPAFNFQGAYIELETMSVEVDRLHRVWESDARVAKESKSAWEEASKRRDKAALEFRRRRLEKADDGDPVPAAPEETNLMRCIWEQEHQDEECPICSAPEAAAKRGFAGTPRDSVLHVESADKFAAQLDAEELADVVAEAGLTIPPRTILGWTVDEHAAVNAWAEGQLGLTDEKPDRPKVLGTSHVASAGRDSEPQTCTQCDDVLIAGGDDPNYYETGGLVGTDCKGKPKKKAEADHHYPQKTGKKKKGRKA